jgi:hypothetical protein
MAVMMREAWTDGRLDDLAKRMDKGFDRVDGDIREVKAEVGALNTRFDSMQRTMIIGFVTLFASIFASVIGGVLAVLALS